jgi:hypothetical protein
VANPADQPRERLQEMQPRRHRAQPQAAERGAGRIAVRRAPRGEQGLRERRAERSEQQRRRPEQRPPQHAQCREREQRRDDEVPLRHQRKRLEQARLGFVRRLERRKSPHAVVHALHPAECVLEPASVHAARPHGVTRHVVLLGPFDLQHRFGLAIARLLLPVRAHRLAPVMPDECGGMEADLSSRGLDPPADVDVVAPPCGRLNLRDRRPLPRERSAAVGWQRP